MAAETMISVSSVSQFDKILAENESALVVVHFSADWAPQCEQMKEVLIELSKEDELKSALFLEVEAEKLSEISLKYGISAVPTFVFIRNKEVIQKLNGANVPELTKGIRDHAKHEIKSFGNVSKPMPVEDLNSRLKKLINAAPCMLFMKGNPNEPKCGFSKQTVAILDSLKTDYSSFDILTDETVRQGLKEYSKWPTYPQLYVKGELVGGLDIIKEMNESGELEALLPKKRSLDERLTELVNKAPVTVFMKGNRETPRCGFSKQLIAILNETQIPYVTFDILEDEDVRQGLKTFSNWPTYPQVYVNGNLIGGLDIVKELKESDELLSTLKP